MQSPPPPSHTHIQTGTRIIYDRRFLLQMRNSPLSKSPPPKLATIPDILNENIAGTPPRKTKSPEPAKPNNHGELLCVYYCYSTCHFCVNLVEIFAQHVQHASKPLLFLSAISRGKILLVLELVFFVWCFPIFDVVNPPH